MHQIVRMKSINCTFSGMLGSREIGLCSADAMDEQSKFYARRRWHTICTKKRLDLAELIRYNLSRHRTKFFQKTWFLRRAKGEKIASPLREKRISKGHGL